MRSVCLALLLVTTVAHAQDNPAIDMPGHLRIAAEAAEHRSTRRVSESQFIRMSREPGTVILDARSTRNTVSGTCAARSISALRISRSRACDSPDPAARILIYCNNNFVNDEGPFPTKLASASLNLSTYIALYNYGYRNVYELGPTIDPRRSQLEFEPR